MDADIIAVIAGLAEPDANYGQPGTVDIGICQYSTRTVARFIPLLLMNPLFKGHERSSSGRNEQGRGLFKMESQTH